MKSLHLIAATLGLFFVTSCGNNPEQAKEIEALKAEVATLKSKTEADKKQKETLENNKKVVVKFYEEFFGNKDLSAADKYIGDVYIQHNPMVADGKKPLVDAAKEWFKGSTEKEAINILNVVAENDLVFLQIGDKHPNGDKSMVIDVFRVTNGKITEHWDAFAEFKKGDTSENPNPLF